jgi:hypothetical protein
MSILNVKSKRSNYKLVGVSMPSPYHNYMSLYSIAKKTSKSAILAGLIEEWCKEMTSHKSETQLIVLIAKEINAKWKIEKITNKRKNFDFYKSRLEAELVKKGITKDQIQRIFTKLKE